ncbi:MAG: YHS domain-containing protein [Candidatus Aminicenantes bacterium]|nr:YHS domain-containing protein [Candidatus Aminicenantes bacterium]
MFGLLRFIAYALLGYIAYLLFRFFTTVNKGSRRPKSIKSQSGLMVKDETCNIYLPKEDAIKVTFEGKDYFFCSDDCKQKFLTSKKPH